MKKLIFILFILSAYLGFAQTDYDVQRNNAVVYETGWTQATYTGIATDTLTTVQDTIDIVFNMRISSGQMVKRVSLGTTFDMRSTADTVCSVALYGEDWDGDDYTANTVIAASNCTAVSTDDMFTVFEAAATSTIASYTITQAASSIASHSVTQAASSIASHTVTQAASSIASYTVTQAASSIASHTVTQAASSIASYTELTTESVDSVEAFDAITATHDGVTGTYNMTFPIDTLIYSGTEVCIYDTTKYFPADAVSNDSTDLYYANITRVDSMFTQGQTVVVAEQTMAIAEATQAHAKHAIQRKAVTNTVSEQTITNGDQTVAEQAITNGDQTVAEQTITNGDQTVAEQAITNGTQTVAEQSITNGTQTVAEQTLTPTNYSWRKYVVRLIYPAAGHSSGTGIKIDKIELKLWTN